MSTRILVLADDLTGALDTGVQFTASGWATVVIPIYEKTGELGDAVAQVQESAGGDVPVAVVVNTESRHISADVAACRVRELVARARSANIHQFYKKTDSTLRGNVAAELRALHDAAGGKPLFFVPAYPDTGRTTRESIHYVDGVPLAETSFAGDVRGGVRESNVLRLLGGPDETVQAGPPPAQLYREGVRGHGIIVLDAETNEDLETIAEYLAETSQLALTAGPGGFAKYLASVAPAGSRATASGGEAPAASQAASPGNARADAPQAASPGSQAGEGHSGDAPGQSRPAGGPQAASPGQPQAAASEAASPGQSPAAESKSPTLVICGSLHSASTEQLERARRAGLRGVTLAEPGGDPLVEGRGGGAPAAQLAGILERDARAFLRTALPETSEAGPGAAGGATAPGGRGTGQSAGGGTSASEATDSPASTAEAVLSQIAGVARAAVEQSGACNLVIFGGDTALEVVRELGIARISPQFEISTGVVRSVGVAPAGEDAAAPDAGASRDAGGGPQGTAEAPDARGGQRAPAPQGASPTLHERVNPRRFTLVTKAGGFGGSDVLAEIFDTLSSGGYKEQRT